nr:odorant receptor Or1 [Helicoverpa armigera]
MALHQIDCFKIHMKFWKFLAVWPGEDSTPRYKYYSTAFITTYIFIYMILFTINFSFLPKQLDIFIEDLLFYFTDCTVVSKSLTMILKREKIYDLFDMLESDIFQPDDAEGLAIIEKAKKFNKLYWKILTTVSFTSSAAHLSPIVVHFILGTELELPVCSYGFLSEAFREMFVVPLYLYQGSGIMFHMMYNVNIDSFFAGLMVLTIAQLDVLDKKLRKVTDKDKHEDADGETSRQHHDKHREAVRKINQCIIHYEEINK